MAAVGAGGGRQTSTAWPFFGVPMPWPMAVLAYLGTLLGLALALSAVACFLPMPEPGHRAHTSRAERIVREREMRRDHS